jgi:hypothetical protein
MRASVGRRVTANLSAQLVAARIATGDGDPRPLLRKVMLDRIDAPKAKHELLRK